MAGSHPTDDVVSVSSKEPETPPLRHRRYYFDDQQSVFLVEKTFFKVHRYFLVRESEVFRTMFSCPSSEGGQEGVNDGKPIHLPGITCRQFEALLDFFYERQHPIQVKNPSPVANFPNEVETGRNQVPLHEAEIQAAQCVAFCDSDEQRLFNLLTISTFYDFGLVREYAIHAIEANGGLDPVDKICYANQCDIPEWLVHAYKELCKRNAPLEIFEAERIGFPTAILIAKAREQFLKQTKNRSPWDSEDEDEVEILSAIVNKVFFDTTQPS